MKFEPGDIVLILHSNEEGKIIEIINNEMLLVEVGGIQFPVYADQVDHPYFKKFAEKKIVENKSSAKYIDEIKKEKNPHKAIVKEGVWINFFPAYNKDVLDEYVVNYFKLYLINQTSLAYHFDYAVFLSGNRDFALINQIEPLSEFYLHDIPFEEMNASPRFEFEFSLTEAQKDKVPYFEIFLKPKAKQLFKKLEEMQIKNEPSFSFDLFDKYPGKTKDAFIPVFPGSVQKVYDISKTREILEPARSVIDLHIEKLTDSWKHMSNFEILTIQLKTFEKYYDLALVHYQPSLIVIHGVGIGKLRNEIHDILRSKKEVKSFVNQYHPNYGYGATEIFFEYR